MITHFSRQCPGLHGPGSATLVQETSIARLVESHATLEIPVMQRRYCWGNSMLDRFWADTVSVTVERGSDVQGSHRVGKAVFRERDQRNEDDRKTLLVVDGQQRITTSLLMCAAIRNELLTRVSLVSNMPEELPHEQNLPEESKSTESWIHSNARDAIKRLSNILFNAEFPDSYLPSDEILHQSRLIPSFLDREPFFAAITDKNCDTPSAVSNARSVFRNKAAILSTRQLVAAASFASQVSIMAIHIQTVNINLSQVFQWLQESAISADKILYNPTPGMQFGNMDLIRNLTISHYVDRPSDELESIYRMHWLPLETLCKSQHTLFDDFLALFLAAQKENENIRLVSEKQNVAREAPHTNTDSASPSPQKTSPGFVAPMPRVYGSRNKNSWKAAASKKSVADAQQEGDMKLYLAFIAWYQLRVFASATMPQLNAEPVKVLDEMTAFARAVLDE
ncbi:hypothetical protein HDU81_005925 [Chytriomyces hyalinus]|nr:hypothetical protein HDU81_005925 [Chytriomyces hyalinus]